MILHIHRFTLNNDVDNESEAIIQASQHGYIDILHLLLDDGRCDFSVQNGRALCVAIVNDHVESLRLLLDMEGPFADKLRSNDQALLNFVQATIRKCKFINVFFHFR